MTKNCPFCFSDSLECIDDHDGTRPFFFVFCNHCEACGPTMHSTLDAMKYWDIRQTEPDEPSGDHPLGGMGYGYDVTKGRIS